MKKLTLLFTFFLAVSLTACGLANSQKTAADSTEHSETSLSNTSTSMTGVPACDDYLADIEKLVDNPNVPQVTRDSYRQKLEQNLIAWKQAAPTLHSKLRLETGCKAASDSIKPILEQYNK